MSYPITYALLSTLGPINCKAYIVRFLKMGEHGVANIHENKFG